MALSKKRMPNMKLLIDQLGIYNYMKNNTETTRNYLQFVITVSIFFVGVFPNVVPIGYILIYSDRGISSVFFSI
jgi:hypothetical protein